MRHRLHNMMPVVMGVGMGAMMLWMLHNNLPSGSAPGWAAAAVFVGAHVALAALVGIAAVFTARLSPRVQSMLARLHRPSIRNMAIMLGYAVLTIVAAHLIIHGGL